MSNTVKTALLLGAMSALFGLYQVCDCPICTESRATQAEAAKAKPTFFATLDELTKPKRADEGAP